MQRIPCFFMSLEISYLAIQKRKSIAKRTWFKGNVNIFDSSDLVIAGLTFGRNLLSWKCLHIPCIFHVHPFQRTSLLTNIPFKFLQMCLSILWTVSVNQIVFTSIFYGIIAVESMRLCRGDFNISQICVSGQAGGKLGHPSRFQMVFGAKLLPQHYFPFNDICLWNFLFNMFLVETLQTFSTFFCIRW